MKRGEFEENLAMLMGSGITYHKMKSEDAIRTEYLRLTAEVAQLRELWHNITMRCQEREQEVARMREALAEVLRVHDAATSPDLHYHLCPQWRGVHGKCNCGADKAIENARAAMEPRP